MEIEKIIERFMTSAASYGNWHYVLNLQWLLNALESATSTEIEAFDNLMRLHAKGE